MAASVTLFPALLGYLGRHIDRLRLPLGRRAPVTVAAGGHVEPGRGWLRWSRLIQRHRVSPRCSGVAILLALAAPFLGVRFGFPDAGNDREEHAAPGRRTTCVAEASARAPTGRCCSWPSCPRAGDTAALDGSPRPLRRRRRRRGRRRPPSSTRPATPRSSPSCRAPARRTPRTEDLVERLRDTLTAALAGTGASVHVGGVTATAIDSTANIARRIPLLIGGVVLLSMLLLLVSFRSVAVAVKAAVMNLLSVAAAYGVVALVLQGGWAGQLIGIDTATPLPAFIPVLMFAVLFGLSMDYEVFLVSRMREVWTRTGDNSRAVTDGLAGTGRVITAAAAIMIAVFAAFIPSPDVVLKVIGVGMAAAILLDATVMRLLLVPAVMHILGRVNWWMPAWLVRRPAGAARRGQGPRAPAGRAEGTGQRRLIAATKGAEALRLRTFAGGAGLRDSGAEANHGAHVAPGSVGHRGAAGRVGAGTRRLHRPAGPVGRRWRPVVYGVAGMLVCGTTGFTAPVAQADNLGVLGRLSGPGPAGGRPDGPARAAVRVASFILTMIAVQRRLSEAPPPPAGDYSGNPPFTAGS